MAGANNYLQRTDSIRPNAPVSQRSYAVKAFEGTDLDIVTASANLWLWNLPSQQNDWAPHLVSTEMGGYEVLTGPDKGHRYVLTLTLYLEGRDIGPSPTGFP